MDAIPAVAQDNLGQLFRALVWYQVSQEQNRKQVNLSYRGLGNPQQSECVLVLQDGIPIVLDFVGFPTLYYLPPLQGVKDLQVIRGGSLL